MSALDITHSTIRSIAPSTESNALRDKQPKQPSAQATTQASTQPDAALATLLTEGLAAPVSPKASHAIFAEARKRITA